LLTQELRRRREEGSPSRVLAEDELRACKQRLAEVPLERDKLVEGYGKGLIPDDLMEGRLRALDAELDQLQVQAQDLQRRLDRLESTEEQETQVLAFAEQLRLSLDNLTNAERQEIVRLLIERVIVASDRAIVEEVVPLPPNDGGIVQLHTNSPQILSRKLRD
jgi:hypothetical protein